MQVLIFMQLTKQNIASHWNFTTLAERLKEVKTIMKKKTFTGKLVRYERKNNSYYGNPKYFGVFEDAEGNILCATTATDASCAYGFLNYPEQERTLTYHTTRTGNNIIDYIKF